ncbi:MAG: protein phosphatase 2C domain-containing protein [Bryobacteraceae bacterium]
MNTCFGVSDTGCVRANNEDYYLLAPEMGLYVLADGMGGARAGERASQLAVETLASVVRSAGRRDPEVLLEAMQEANRQVLSLAKTDRSLEGMGTTLVAALDQGDQIHVASVGDSRAYMLADGAFTVVTQDQSWVNEVGRILMGMTEEALKTHPLRHVLTMAIGTGVRLVVNRYARPWKDGSILLLSSDGLHGVVQPGDIEEILRRRQGNESLEEKCHGLIEAAREAGAPDNVTAVLLKKAG